MGEQVEPEFSGIRYLYFSNTLSIKTFDTESQLPSLPVPSLKETLQKYLKSVQPFLDEEELTHTKNLVTKFQTGCGQELQQLLVKKAASSQNWMEKWWADYAYLMSRTPLLPSHNMAGIHPLNITDWKKSETKAMERMAISLWILLEFFEIFRSESLRPQFAFSGDALSMEQFRNFFNMTRVPKTGKDELISWFKTEKEGDCPQHMIVLCNGHIWFLFPWDTEGKRLHIDEIEEQLKFIQDQSDLCQKGPGVAALSLDNRDRWAENREWLKSLSKRNAQNLELVESAIAHLSFEDETPEDFNEVLWNCMCGYSVNRWCDKSYTGIVFKNGMLGLNCEHTPCDAMVSVLMGHFTHELYTKEMRQKPLKTTKLRRVFSKPYRLEFDLDSLLYSAIRTSKEENFALQKSIDARFFVFSHYGRLWIKNRKYHPDTFVQCALQLAYYILYQKVAATYETATTRQFYHGRTETVRSCTLEMTEWVRTMQSPSSTPSDKRKKLNAAMSKHLELMREAQSAKGIDRHLMGLYIAALENNIDIPELFTDAAFIKSGGGGNFVLSTSTVGPSYTLGGVAPMTDNGYAVIYSFCPDHLQFTITSLKCSETCVQGFVGALTDALLQMKQLTEIPSSNI